KIGDLVVGAAQLEGKNRLQVFALQQHFRAQTSRQPRHAVERRFDRYIVDTRLEDALDIGFTHERCWYLNSVLPTVSVSPSCRICRPTRRPFTSTPLVLLRSSTIQ